MSSKIKYVRVTIGTLAFICGWIGIAASIYFSTEWIQFFELSERHHQLSRKLVEESDLIAQTAFTPLLQWG